ncbi:hypothetical protein ACFRLW_30385 [Streptomyces sp. NPDC056728]
MIGRNGPKWARFLAGEDIGEDPDNWWRENVRAQTAPGLLPCVR